MVDKSIFSHYPIDYQGKIWEKLKKLEFTPKTELPKDILCFLETGIIRKFFNDQQNEETKEICVDFFFTGDIFTAKAQNDFENQFSYQPIEKGTLWYVEMSIVRQMFFASELCSATQKVFMDEQIRKKNMREILLLKSSPTELYKYILKNNPKLIQFVPLKYLASYIGITPQALSRIRRQIN